nr:phosphoadenosine phosphosulfate reductase family protein [Bacillus subtilis]
MIKQHYDDGKKHIHVLSYGGGTQSTALLLMALKGEINGVIPDYIIFSDTGWEPQHVYNWIQKINKHIKATYGREIIFTDNGNIRDDIVQGAETGDRFASIPFFTRDSKGEIGIARRQCTNEYKILPVNRKIRSLLGYKPRRALKKSFTYGKALALMKFSGLSRAGKAGK